MFSSTAYYQLMVQFCRLKRSSLLRAIRQDERSTRHDTATMDIFITVDELVEAQQIDYAWLICQSPYSFVRK